MFIIHYIYVIVNIIRKYDYLLDFIIKNMYNILKDHGGNHDGYSKGDKNIERKHSYLRCV